MTIAELAPGQSGVIAAYRGADAEERPSAGHGADAGRAGAADWHGAPWRPADSARARQPRVHPPASGAANHPVRW